MIYIDKREKNITEYWRNVPHKMVVLDEGDYTNEYEDFIVERKKDFDLPSSIINRKVYMQLDRMRTLHPTTPLFFIFEGDMDALMGQSQNDGIRKMIKHFPYKLAHIYGCHYINTFDYYETMMVLEFLDDYASHIKDMQPTFEPIHISKRLDDRIRYLAGGLYRVGISAATIALETYGSIAKFAKACRDSPKEVQKLKGWGKVSIGRVVDMFYDESPLRTNSVSSNSQVNIIRHKQYEATKRGHK